MGWNSWKNSDSITFDAHWWGTNSINIRWFDEATTQIYTKNFADFVDNILVWKTNPNITSKLEEKISSEKNNDLLITIYNKLDSILIEILWLVPNWNNYNVIIKNIEKKYNLEKSHLIPIIKNIIQDIFKFSVWVKAEWLDEIFNNFLDEIAEKWTEMDFNDLIDFITIIETIILQSIKNHIEWRKWVDGNWEKIKELITILSLERKRLTEQYLFKYNIDNSTKVKILSAILSEKNFNIDKDSIDEYIINIIWYRYIHVKLPYLISI